MAGKSLDVMNAVAAGNLKKVKSILKKNRELVNEKSAEGYTPLLRAVQAGNIDMVKLLIEYEADVDMVDNLHCTSLHKAVFHSHEGIAEILLSSGASVSEQDKFGNTPLCIAVREGKLEMVRLLVSHGADVNAHYNEFNLTPLHRASADGQREMVKLLLSKGAKLNVKNRDGYTPLKIAKLYRRKDIYELLHKHGAR